MPLLHRLAAVIVALSMPLTGSAGLGLAQSSMSGGKSFEYARELTAIGPRLSGSASYQRAAEWSAGQFRAMGLTRVQLEPFPIERGWERVSARGRIVAPIDQPLHVESLGWSPSTPDGGIDAEVVALETFSRQAWSPSSLRGRIVLLPEGEPPGDPDTTAKMAGGLGAMLRAVGALAILAPDSDLDNQLSARTLGFGAIRGVLPAAQVDHDTAQMIRGQLSHGPVRMSLELINRITPGAAMVNNVVADIVGRDRPDEWVIVGAHLDSWDFGTGAQDNATGVAMVLEAARAIAALKQPPRRSLRFALWGGEEQGQLGSTAYTLAHTSDLVRVIAVLNTDAGTGRVIGWTAPGRPDLVKAVRLLTQDFLSDLGAATFDESLRYAFQSDGAPFILAGIPMLDLNADDTAYEEIHHKATDTIERVDVHNLAVGAAVVAATAHEIADATGQLAPRLDRLAVERLRQKRD